MNKLKVFLSNLELDKVIIGAFLFRAMFSDFGFAQASVPLILLSYIGYSAWLSKQKANNISEEVKEEVKRLQDVVSSMSIQRISKVEQQNIGTKRFF